MAPELFAGICVRDYEAAKPWYERLLGSEPSFVAHETECVWELGEHRFLFILVAARLAIVLEDSSRFEERREYGKHVHDLGLVHFREFEGHPEGFARFLGVIRDRYQPPKRMRLDLGVRK